MPSRGKDPEKLSPGEKKAQHEAELEARRVARAAEKEARRLENQRKHAEAKEVRRKELDASKALGKPVALDGIDPSSCHLDPTSFTAFANSLIVKLTPGQSVICKVAYDGIDPIDLPEDERELAEIIFGPVERIDSQARAVFCAVVGARGGKSSIVVALRLLHLALTVPIDHLGPGERAVALIIAPDLRLARQNLRFALGYVEASPALLAKLGGSVGDDHKRSKTTFASDGFGTGE